MSIPTSVLKTITERIAEVADGYHVKREEAVQLWAIHDDLVGLISTDRAAR